MARDIDIKDYQEAKEQGVQIWPETEAPWELLTQAWSPTEQWYRSTKALEIGSLGVLVNVSHFFNGQIAESTVFIPGAAIERKYDETGKVVKRRLKSNPPLGNSQPRMCVCRRASRSKGSS